MSFTSLAGLEGIPAGHVARNQWVGSNALAPTVGCQTACAFPR
jgi:hypothetical protein